MAAVGEKQRDQFIKAGFTPREELHVSGAPEAPVVRPPEGDPVNAAVAPPVEAKKAPKRAPRAKKVV